MSTYYSVLEVTPTTQEWIPNYLEAASKLVSKHGGQYIAQSSEHEILEGDGDNPAIRVIIRWPSRQAAISFMQDPEYAPHLEARTAGSISRHALVEGNDATF